MTYILDKRVYRGAQKGHVLTADSPSSASFQLLPVIAIPIAVQLPTIASVVDVISYTVPPAPIGPGRFVMMFAYIRLSGARVGSGSVVARLGNSLGGQEFLLTVPLPTLPL
jgi:hypothetical protein